MENLLNQTFNYFTVIDGPIKRNHKIYWKCQCKCGTIKEVRSDCLKNGSTKSCGCYKNKILIVNNKKRQTVDITNQRFGKLVAKKSTDKRTADGRVIWLCECDCGNIKEVSTHDLLQKKVQSCGCMRSSGEHIIESLLKENNIFYETQKSFNTCRFPENNYLAKFDFWVNHQYIIEYDGEQHFYFKDNPHTWNTYNNHLIVKQHDEFKNYWCKKNNIPIIRIPYTYKDKIKLEDLLLETTQFRVV